MARDAHESARGLARHPVEDEQKSVLGTLRDGADFEPVVGDGEKDRRRGKVLVEQIVVHELLVPDPPSRVGFQGDERVREKVRAMAVASPKIGTRRFGRHVDDPALFIESEARPVRRSAYGLVGFRRP